MKRCSSQVCRSKQTREKQVDEVARVLKGRRMIREKISELLVIDWTKVASCGKVGSDRK